MMQLNGKKTNLNKMSITQTELINIFNNTDNVKKFGAKNSDGDLSIFMEYNVYNAPQSKLSKLLFLEFGVFTGNTFNMISRALPKSQILYGFDTFTGLPENWMIDDETILYSKGTFGLDYIPHNTANQIFIQGMVEDTLSNFLNTHPEKISLAHLDMDLYNPTIYTLEMLYDRLMNGTILILDDFYNLPGWEKHSFRALLDFINKYQVKFQPLATVGWDDGWASVSLRIIK